MINRSSRRAEEFNEAWSRRDRRSGDLDAELAELVAAADALVRSATIEPDPQFSADLRARLMAAAPTTMVAGEPDPTALLTHAEPRSSRRGRLRAAIAGLAIVAGGAGTVAASANSAPGDMLYGIKITTEKIERAAATNDQRLGHVMLDQASERLDEAVKVAGDRHDPATVNSLLEEFSSAADQGTSLLLGDPRDPSIASEDVAFVADFTESASAKLAELAEFLPPADRAALEAAVAELLSIAADLDTSCPACLRTTAAESLVSLGELTSTVDEAAQRSPVASTAPPTANTPTANPRTEGTAPTPRAGATDKPIIAPPTTAPENLGEALEPVTGGLIGNKDQQGLVPGLVNGLGLGGLLGTP